MDDGLSDTFAENESDLGKPSCGAADNETFEFSLCLLKKSIKS
jgi:hypothetical protein